MYMSWSLLYMEAEGVSSFVEVGAGKALSGMVKRIAKEPEILSVGTPGDVEAFLKTI